MKLYVDASFDKDKQIAGFGILIEDGVKQRMISNWIKAPNNNYAEMWAIYQASILSGGRGTIYTDSQTALMYINNEIKDKPRTYEQYIRHQQMRVLAYKINKLGCDVQKTKAHLRNFKHNSLANNMADLLAKDGRSKYYDTHR